MTIQPPFRIYLDEFMFFFPVGQALHVPDFRAICQPVFLKFPPLTRPPRVLWCFTGVQFHEALRQDRKCLLLGPCQTLRHSYSHGLLYQNGNENCSYVEIILTFEQFFVFVKVFREDVNWTISCTRTYGRFYISLGTIFARRRKHSYSLLNSKKRSSLLTVYTYVRHIYVTS